VLVGLCDILGCTPTGRRAPVNTRTAAGEPLCSTCYRAPPARCDRCKEINTINSRKDGETICRRYYRSPRRACGQCGHIKRIAVRARDGQPDLCGACHWSRVVDCTRCARKAPGFGVRQGAALCLHCSAADKVDALLTAPDGRVAPALAGLRGR